MYYEFFMRFYILNTIFLHSRILIFTKTNVNVTSYIVEYSTPCYTVVLYGFERFLPENGNHLKKYFHK